MRNRIGLSYLFACWLAMSSTAMAQDNGPDLMPVVIDAGQGVVEIRNIGTVTANPSQVFVVCSRASSESKHAESCAAGLQLPGFIEKWNALPFEVPALLPGAGYRFQLFGSGAFQHRPGTYGMRITADPKKQIAEADEKNNTVRLDTVIRTEPGILRLVARAESAQPELPAHYVVYRHGPENRDAKPVAFGEIRELPLEVPVAAGDYDVRVTRKQAFSPSLSEAQRNIKALLGQRVLGESELANLPDLHVGAKTTVDLPIRFEPSPPGKLMLHVISDGNPARARITIDVPGSGSSTTRILQSYPAFLEPESELKLLPGRYLLSVEPEDDGGVLQGHGYGKRQISITVRSGRTTEKRLAFTSIEKGELVLTALVDGSRSKAEIGVRRTGTNMGFGTVISTYNLLSNRAALLPGHYDISIRPLEHALSPGGVDVFHGKVEAPGIRSRRVKGIEPVILRDIEIEPGKALNKTVKFEKRQQG